MTVTDGVSVSLHDNAEFNRARERERERERERVRGREFADTCPLVILIGKTCYGWVEVN